MSGEGSARRSSWKAEAIRRGDLKISGPMPITEDVPLNDVEEKQYAKKHHSDQPATVPEMPSQRPPPPPSQPRTPNERSRFVEDTSGMHNDNDAIGGEAIAGAIETHPEQRHSPPEPMTPALNTPSPFSSGPESTAQAVAKKRRKSGLRNAIRMMFGRRRKSEPQQQQQEEQEETTTPRHGHHRSEPITVHESPKLTQEDTFAPRISDLPVRELKPITPLADHLPFPMNVNAPQEMSPQHEYLAVDWPASGARRRASLSGMISGEEAQAARKQSFDAQGIDSPTSPQIGIALSSPPEAATQSSQPAQQKRRSRSATALRDITKAKSRPSTDRRRSEEIRFWRNSYQSGSVYSTATPRPQTAQTVDSMRTTDTQNQSPVKMIEPTIEADETSDTIAGASNNRDFAPATAAIEQHDQDLSQIPLPMETFNFGNLKSAFESDTAEPSPERVQHTYAAPQPEKRMSIEDRVQFLEDSMRTLETSVRRLSTRSHRQTVVLENAPKGRRSRNSSSTSEKPSLHFSSKSSSHNALYLQHESDSHSSEHHPLSAVGEYPSPDANNDRPETMILLDEQGRPKTAPQPHSISPSDFAQLAQALKHERTCRRDLERQVYALQRDVADLHSIVARFISHSPSYPTPSPDTLTMHNTRLEEHSTTPRAIPRKASVGLQPEARDHTVRETIVSRFSGTNSDYEEDRAEKEVSAESTEDVTSPEAWATPKEESGYGAPGFFAAQQRALEEGEEEMF